MHLNQIIQRFEVQANKGLVYRLASGAPVEIISDAEDCLRVEFPKQVASFWEAFNGLEVNDPPFKVLSLSEMKREDKLLIFCFCNQVVRIAFDLSAKNQAGQWSIVNADTNYRITLTMASFWSIHMWSWIIKRRPFWQGQDG